MKVKVDIATATKAKLFADYKGNRYFFCCGDCPATFKANPEKFKNAPHIKSPNTMATKMTCPVMKGKVDVAKATKAKLFADYKGNRYFFCCGDCPAKFKANPDKFKNAPHMKLPVAK